MQSFHTKSTASKKSSYLDTDNDSIISAQSRTSLDSLRKNQSQAEKIIYLKNKFKTLLDEKTELKRKNKRLIADLEIKSGEYEAELKTIQQQLDDVLIERENLSSQLENMQSSFDNERKEIVRTYEQKLRNPRNDNPAVVKRLENTIIALQEKLTQNSIDQSNELVTMEQKIKDITNEFVEQNNNYNKKLLEQEKTIQELTRENIDKINSLQNVINLLEPKNKLLSNTINDLEKQKRFELDSLRLEYEQQIANIKENHDNELRALTSSCEGKLFEMDRQFKATRATNKDELEKDISILKTNYEKKIDHLTDNYRKVIDQLQDEKNKLSYQIQVLQRQPDINEEKIKEVRAEYDTLLAQKDAELAQKEEEFRINSEESYSTNEKLTRHINDAVNTLAALRTDHKKERTKTIEHLATLRDTHNGELKAKNDLIASLEQKLNLLGNESIDKINDLERKLRASSENLDSCSKLIEQKSKALSEYEERFTAMLKSIQTAEQYCKEKEAITVLNNELKGKVVMYEAKLTTYESKLASCFKSLEAERQKVNIVYNQLFDLAKTITPSAHFQMDENDGVSELKSQLQMKDQLLEQAERKITHLLNIKKHNPIQGLPIKIVS
jgi:chromosome segregation ATPase